MQEYTTRHGRKIVEEDSESPVTRVRIKKDELVFRYAKDTSEDRKDDIYDSIRLLEYCFDKKYPTVRIKILAENDLNTFQCEIGCTEKQTKLIKTRGIDY